MYTSAHVMHRCCRRYVCTSATMHAAVYAQAQHDVCKCHKTRASVTCALEGNGVTCSVANESMRFTQNLMYMFEFASNGRRLSLCSLPALLLLLLVLLLLPLLQTMPAYTPAQHTRQHTYTSARFCIMRSVEAACWQSNWQAGQTLKGGDAGLGWLSRWPGRGVCSCADTHLLRRRRCAHLLLLHLLLCLFCRCCWRRWLVCL